MARAVKMMDVVVVGRMAEMKVGVTEPAKRSAISRTGDVLAEAMRLAGDAELNTQPRSKYRNTVKR